MIGSWVRKVSCPNRNLPIKKFPNTVDISYTNIIRVQKQCTFNGGKTHWECAVIIFRTEKRNIMENIMKFFKKHSKKKTILILSESVR